MTTPPDRPPERSRSRQPHRFALFARRAIALALCAGALAAVAWPPAGSPAEAYAPARVTSTGAIERWDLANLAGNAVGFLVNDQGCDDRATFTAGVDEFAAVVDSFQVWTRDTATSLRVRYDGTTSATGANDGQNVVIFDNTGSVGVGVFGLTTLTAQNTGVMVDADIELNDLNFAWDTLGNRTTGTPGRAMIEQVVTHEAGHALGLDHSFIAAASMFPQSQVSAIANHTLGTDDLAGIAASYPTAVLATDFGAVTGNVTKAATPVFGAQVLLVDAVAHDVVASAITDQAGDYAIARVPFGEYLAVCAPVDPTDMGGFYATADTDLQAAFFGSLGPADHPVPLLGTHRLTVGPGLLPAIDFAMIAADTPYEPDGEPLPTDIAFGEIVVANLDVLGDDDWFRFFGTAGDVLDFVVLGAQLGARRTGANKRPLDAEFTLFLGNSTNPVMTPTPGPTFGPGADDEDIVAFDVDGGNVDPRVLGFPLPATGFYLLKVSAFADASIGYYLLRVNRPADDLDPNGAASTMTIAPRSVPAGSAQTMTVTVDARNQYGSQLKGDPTLVAEVFDAGLWQTAAESPVGSGTFVYDMPAAAAPGTQTVLARITRGVVVVPLLRTIDVAFTGGLDAATSEVAAFPDTAFADGESRVRVTVTPRDSGGRVIDDPTFTVVVTTTAGTIFTAPAHQEDGTWTAVITAPTAAAVASVAATVNAQALASQVGVTFLATVTPAPPPGGGGGGGGSGGCQAGSGMGGGATALGNALFALMLLLASLALRAHTTRSRPGGA